jgi:hypothetical protein
MVTFLRYSSLWPGAHSASPGTGTQDRSGRVRQWHYRQLNLAGFQASLKAVCFPSISSSRTHNWFKHTHPPCPFPRCAFFAHVLPFFKILTFSFLAGFQAGPKAVCFPAISSSRTHKWFTHTPAPPSLFFGVPFLPMSCLFAKFYLFSYLACFQASLKAVCFPSIFSSCKQQWFSTPPYLGVACFVHFLPFGKILPFSCQVSSISLDFISQLSFLYLSSNFLYTPLPPAIWFFNKNIHYILAKWPPVFIELKPL